MPDALQNFFANAIPNAVSDLLAAFDRLPEDKRNWSPMGDARTAVDQIAEVAIQNGSTAEIIRTGSFPENYDFSEFAQLKKTLSGKNLDELKEILQANSSKVVAAILEIPDEDLTIEVQMPWGAMTMPQIMAYPYWNTIYHEGQINYIASMLGCLK